MQIHEIHHFWNSYAILSGFQLPITLLSSACWVSWAARRTSSLNGFSYRENCTCFLSAKQKGSNQTVSFPWGYALCIWERSWDWTFWWLLLNSLSSSLMRSSRIDASFPRRSVFNESKRIGFFAGPKAPLFWVSIPRCRHRWFCSGGPIVHWLEFHPANLGNKITGPVDCFFGLMFLCLLTLGKSNLYSRRSWKRQKSQAQTVPFGPSDSSCFQCLQPTPAKIVKFAFESSCLECCTAHGDPAAETHSRKEEAPALANPRVPSARQSPSEKGRFSPKSLTQKEPQLSPSLAAWVQEACTRRACH